MESEQIKKKIIVALDVPNVDEARRHIAELRREVGAFKIGLQLFTSAGADFVRDVVEDGTKIFLDLKFHDIPITVAKAAVEAARLGVWMFNVHSSGGSEMIRRTVESVREVCAKENLKNPKVIGVTVLTSSNQAAMQEVGVTKGVKQQVLDLVKMSFSNGLDGVVASPMETEAIRNHIDSREFVIVTPGIRINSMDNDDQKRVMTPADAVSVGADYLVIGRPVLAAEDKLKTVRQIIESIKVSR